MLEETFILILSAFALHSLSKASFAQIHKRLLIWLFVIFATRSAMAILAIQLSNHHQRAYSIFIGDYGVRFLCGVAAGLFLAFWITGGWTTVRTILSKSPASHDQP